MEEKNIDNNTAFQRILGCYERAQESEEVCAHRTDLGVYQSVFGSFFMYHTNKMPAIYDCQSHIFYLSEKAAEFLGLDIIVRDMPEKLMQNGFVATEHLQSYQSCFQFDGEIECKEALLKIHQHGEQEGWIRIRSSVLPLKQEEGCCLLFTIEDWTARHENEVEQEKWKYFYFSQRDDDLTNYRYNITKDVFEYIKGADVIFSEDPKGISLHEMRELVVENTIYPKDRETYQSILNRAYLQECHEKQQCTIHLEHRRIRRDGSVYWAENIIQLMEDPYSKELLAFISVLDIDQKKREELELKERSVTDALTGILNRGAVINEVNRMLKKEKDLMHAFVMIDIDYFKLLNDTLGHITGDQVLEQIANTLKNSQRADDIIGRMGGDEFVLYLKNFRSEKNLQKRMGQLCNTIARWVQNEVEITASVGVALYPRDGKNFEELYKKADQALYQAKTKGRNCFVIYGEDTY